MAEIAERVWQAGSAGDSLVDIIEGAICDCQRGRGRDRQQARLPADIHQHFPLPGLYDPFTGLWSVGKAVPLA